MRVVITYPIRTHLRASLQCNQWLDKSSDPFQNKLSQRTLLYGLYFVCLCVRNLDWELLRPVIPMGMSLNYVVRTSSTAITTSTASRLSKPKSLLNEAVGVSWTMWARRKKLESRDLLETGQLSRSPSTRPRHAPRSFLLTGQRRPSSWHEKEIE